VLAAVGEDDSYPAVDAGERVEAGGMGETNEEKGSRVVASHNGFSLPVMCGDE